MVDYGFYTDTYLGQQIPLSAFPEAMQRAKDALAHFARIYRITAAGEVAQNMALCAMAESIYSASHRRGDITAATVGNLSVRYAQPPSLNHELLKKAAIYLDIRRGVG